jgi:uroporphyrinogen-III synthase
VRVAAVGAATATALKEHGLAVDFLPDEALGEALADQLPVATGERVLLPRSAIGSQSLPRGLRVRGVVVDDVATYTTVAEPLAPATMIELARGFDAILFASGSAASAFVAGIEGHQACGAALQQAVIACIGPATAESVRSLGLTPGVIAQEHTGPGLVRALEQHYIQTWSP